MRGCHNSGRGGYTGRAHSRGGTGAKTRGDATVPPRREPTAAEPGQPSPQPPEVLPAQPGTLGHQSAGPPPPATRPARRIRLYVGARHRQDLYDLPDLARLESGCAGLEVVTALSDDPGASGLHGPLHTVVRQQASWRDCDVFVSGPSGMVQAMLGVLARRASGEQLYCDPYEDPGARLPA